MLRSASVHIVEHPENLLGSRSLHILKAEEVAHKMYWTTRGTEPELPVTSRFWILRMMSPRLMPASPAGDAWLTSGTTTPGLYWLSATPTVLTCIFSKHLLHQIVAYLDLCSVIFLALLHHLCKYLPLKKGRMRGCHRKNEAGRHRLPV